MARTVESKIIDKFLLAFLLHDASKRTGYIYETKIQKLIFISEKEMVLKAKQGFDYYFLKLYHGPFSPELNCDLNDFVQSGVVETAELKNGTQIIPTAKCEEIFKDFGSLSRRNRYFLSTIISTNKKYASISLKRLLNSVYRMHSPLHTYKRGRRAPTIASLSFKTPLIKPLEPEITEQSFSITPEEVATLELYFEKEDFNSLQKASECAKKKPLLRLEEVF